MMKTVLLSLSALALISTVAQAQDVFWRDSNDGTVGANWVGGFGFGGGETPGASNTAVISGSDVLDTTVIYVDSAVTSPAGLEFRDRGATLQIRSGGSLASGALVLRNTFDEGAFNLSIQGGTFTLNSTAWSAGNRLNLTVSSGNMVFNPGGNNSNGLIQGDSIVSISGGTVELGDARITLTDVSNFNWTGGTLSNVNRFQGDGVASQTLTNGGGTFFVNTNTRTDDFMGYNNGTGTTAFAINADGTTDAELSQYTGGEAWDLTTGIVAVDFGSGYTPLIGDSWDFTDLSAGTDFLGSTANIASTSADGNWNVTWDTSSWVSDGVLGITNVTVIPEPSTAVLLGLGLFGLMAGRRRRA